MIQRLFCPNDLAAHHSSPQSGYSRKGSTQGLWVWDAGDQLPAQIKSCSLPAQLALQPRIVGGLDRLLPKCVLLGVVTHARKGFWRSAQAVVLGC